MLELIDICFFRNNKKILNNINLKIENNSFIAITGPNGSGKSTLAKIIMGIEKQDSGKILFNGQDITDLTIDERAKLGISFAFQQPVRFKGITIYDMLKIAANKKLTKQDACSTLRVVGICAEDYLNRELDNSLSGGELKRIEIATVLLRNSTLNIFDEPEAGIDLWSFNNLITIFKNMHASLSSTTLIITHQERILNIADKIILIKNGKIDYFGDRKNVIDSICNNCNACEGGCNHECH